MNEIATTLHTLLAHHIVSFTFRKVNGEIRHAKGTRNLDIARATTNEYIPNPKGEEQPNSYFDVEKMGWRSYKPENLISIDGYAPVEKVSREIPVQKPVSESKPMGGVSGGKPMGGGADIDKIIGGLFGGGGFGLPMGEIRKSMDKLGKDIEIVPLGGKVGTPTFTDKGVELEMGISVEDFAKMVAHYVVEELVTRITR